jgi:hypothetical protein
MFNKIGFGLALTAAFGLMACSDSSSGSDNGKVTLSCKVVKESPLTIKGNAGGRSSATIIYDRNADDKMVVSYDFTSQSDADDECESAQKDSEFEEVTCEGKKVVEVSAETSTEDDFKEMLNYIKEDCIESDGQTVTIDKDGYIIDDDEEEGYGDDKDGGEFLPNPPSCVFDADADEWGYSYSTGKDASGTSSATDVEYRIDGKDLVQVTTTESIGANVKLACSIVKSGDGEYKDEYVSNKIETTCTDEGMITKSTTIKYGYMDEWTKEQVVKNIKSACEAI